MLRMRPGSDTMLNQEDVLIKFERQVAVAAAGDPYSEHQLLIHLD